MTSPDDLIRRPSLADIAAGDQEMARIYEMGKRMELADKDIVQVSKRTVSLGMSIPKFISVLLGTVIVGAAIAYASPTVGQFILDINEVGRRDLENIASSFSDIGWDHMSSGGVCFNAQIHKPFDC